jgi:hypothetical protein
MAELLLQQQQQNNLKNYQLMQQTIKSGISENMDMEDNEEEQLQQQSQKKKRKRKSDHCSYSEVSI